jgi:hypothetical protein
MCPLRHASSALAVAVLLFAVGLGTPRAASPVADAAQGDFAGLVDIGGGRRLYIERRGSGSPAVVLEAGYRSSARIWSEDLHQSAAWRPDRSGSTPAPIPVTSSASSSSTPILRRSKRC